MNAAATNLLIAAVAFAAHKHRNQRRKDAAASPYINHPIGLADLLANEARRLASAISSRADSPHIQASIMFAHH